MKILVDENIPAMTVQELKRMGHNVLDIRGTEKEGSSDADLWILTQQENRLLITTDKGFAQNRDAHHNGILIIRLKKPNRTLIHECAMKAIEQFNAHECQDLLVVMRDNVQSIWRAGKRK